LAATPGSTLGAASDFVAGTMSARDPSLLLGERAMLAILPPEQLALIRSAVAGVPMSWRHDYLECVADLLASNPSPSNADVIMACGSAKRLLTCGIGAPELEEDDD
jgi:hypothetical protein